MPALPTPTKSDSRLLAAVSYLSGIFGLPILVPLIIYLISKEDRYARFHALQALLFQLVLLVLGIGIIVLLWLVSILLFFIAPIASSLVMCLMIPIIILLVVVGYLLLPLYFAYQAYQGVPFMLPGIGGIALQNVGEE